MSIFHYLALHSVVNCHKVKNKTEQKSEYKKNGMYFIASKSKELSRQIGTFTRSENWLESLFLCLNSKDFTRFFRTTVLLYCKLRDLGVFCFVLTDISIKHLDKTFCTVLQFNSWVLVTVEGERDEYLSVYSVMCSVRLHCHTSSELCCQC